MLLFLLIFYLLCYLFSNVNNIIHKTPIAVYLMINPYTAISDSISDKIALFVFINKSI